MGRDVLKSFARIGFFVGGCGLILMLIEPRSSPEFVVSVCNTAIGLTLVIGVIVVSRWVN